MKNQAFIFPDPNTADDTGLVVETTELNAELVLQAYARGIFPWSEDPVRWYSPDPRAIFIRDRIHLPRNLPKLVRRARFVVTYDQAFHEVVRRCRMAHRHEGVWLTRGFLRTYGELHEMGYAHSVEVWQDDVLVGGLYGVQINGFFAGESMFHDVSNASKVAFSGLIHKLDQIGNVLLDAQVINAHTARLGAVLVRRTDYLTILDYALRRPASQRAPAKWLNASNLEWNT